MTKQQKQTLRELIELASFNDIANALIDMLGANGVSLLVVTLRRKIKQATQKGRF